MDLADFDNVKAEKAKATKRYNRLRTIGRFFRAAELCLALLFVSWTFTRLPFAVRISGEFLRRVAGVVSSPLFVFILGNSIVVALFAKSNVFFPSSTERTAETQFYEAFFRNGENRAKPLLEDQEEEIVYDDKQVIVTESRSNSKSSHLARDSTANGDVDETDSDSEPDTPGSDHPKIYRRSKSEVSEKAVRGFLRRSDTGIRRESKDPNDEMAKNRNYPEDKLTNEEFQKTIEAFIAKQLMFRRQESLSIVLHKQA